MKEKYIHTGISVFTLLLALTSYVLTVQGMLLWRGIEFGNNPVKFFTVLLIAFFPLAVTIIFLEVGKKLINNKDNRRDNGKLIVSIALFLLAVSCNVLFNFYALYYDISNEDTNTETKHQLLQHLTKTCIKGSKQADEYLAITSTKQEISLIKRSFHTVLLEKQQELKDSLHKLEIKYQTNSRENKSILRLIQADSFVTVNILNEAGLHIKNIYLKLEVDNRVSLCVKAMQKGIVSCIAEDDCRK
jgi:hypothetical protein